MQKLKVLLLSLFVVVATNCLERELVAFKNSLNGLSKLLNKSTYTKDFLSKKELQDIQVNKYSYESNSSDQVTKVNAAMNIASIYKNRDMRNEMLLWYGKALSFSLIGCTYDVCTQIQNIRQPAAEYILNLAKNLENQNKFDEALKIYQMAGDYFDKKTNTLYQKIENIKLEQKIANERKKKLEQSASEIQRAQKYAEKNNFDEALTILNDLLLKGVGVSKFIQEITKQKNIWEQEHKTEFGWIKFMKLDRSDDIKEGRAWRIKDKWLEISLGTVDAFTTYTLQELIEEADDAKLPCLVVLAKTDNTGSEYLFYDMQEFGKQLLTSGINPSVGKGDAGDLFNNVMIFVKAKEDVQFTLLKSIEFNYKAKSFFNNLYSFTAERVPSLMGEGLTSRIVYTIKKEWTIPGQAQQKVADIFKDEGKEEQFELWSERAKRLGYK